MKQYFILVLLLASTSAFAQKGIRRELSPARGYYKQLAALNPKPSVASAAADKLHFPFDSATAARRLSLKPYYLTNVSLVDFKIPDPPANSSEQTRAELNYLLALQERRTKPDIQSSMHMAGIYYSLRVTPDDSAYSRFRNNLFHIGHSIGTWFNPDDLPLTANLVANVWRDASFFIWSMKLKYLRIRPYKLENDLKNLEETDWAAYPSGHASNSYVNAFLYAELAPEYADIFLKDAFDMAHSREILGVHYPSDSEAGRIFARQFVNKLFQNQNFINDFEAVRNEWKEKAKESFQKPALSGTVTIQR